MRVKLSWDRHESYNFTPNERLYLPGLQWLTPSANSKNCTLVAKITRGRAVQEKGVAVISLLKLWEHSQNVLFLKTTNLEHCPYIKASFRRFVDHVVR